MTGMYCLPTTSTILRIYRFEKFAHGVSFTTTLRRAWQTQPPFTKAELADNDDKLLERSFKEALTHSIDKTDAEWLAATPLNTDLATLTAESEGVRTRWRKLVHLYIQHMFIDVYIVFREEPGAQIGQYTNPSDHVLALEYSTTSDTAVETVCQKNWFVIPVYLDTGVRVRIEMVADPAQTRKFDQAKNPFEIWWIQGSERVKWFVEGGNGVGRKGRGGLAAVLVTGVLS